MDQPASNKKGEAAPPPMSAEDRALLAATQPFTREDWRSWWVIGSTMSALVGSIMLTFMVPSLGAKAALSVLTTVLVIRTFIFYHDHMHGALLANSKLVRLLLSVYGVLMMAPPAVWRYTHNYHHAHHGKELDSDVGTFPVRTIDEWDNLPRRLRVKYRIQRHPITMILGYLTVFGFKLCVTWPVKSPRKYWSSILALVVNGTLHWVLLSYFGWQIWLFAFFAPMFVSIGFGAYLFYMQHCFEGVWFPKDRSEWSYVRAALEGSSYMDVSALTHWITGNIGYHHVHHLNPRIPFYRLPEAMAAIPELQAPRRERMLPWTVLRNWRRNLWDPGVQKMISFAEFEARSAE